jgi:response regulator RpfG family c-di-GMP phosphodiesterase
MQHYHFRYSHADKSLKDQTKREKSKECSIIISDIRMPTMSGFELVGYLKEARPEMRVILMTAFKISKEEAQIVLPSTSVDAFINKPFRSADLMEAIKEITK